MVNSTLGSKQNSTVRQEQIDEREGKRDPFVVFVSFMAFVFLATLLWLFTTNPNHNDQAKSREPWQLPGAPMPIRTSPSREVKAPDPGSHKDGAPVQSDAIVPDPFRR